MGDEGTQARAPSRSREHAAGRITRPTGDLCVGQLVITKSGDTGKWRADALDISGELWGGGVPRPTPPEINVPY